MTSTPTRPNIVLTGFMGTGKSTVGRLVAERLALGFIDTDELIESRHGTVAEIFAGRGEDGFRALERELAAELSAVRGTVISTGGRFMLDPPNAEALGPTGRVFCLTATAEAIVERLLGGTRTEKRPLLAGPNPAERIRRLLEERHELYERFELVDTTGRTPLEVATDIVGRASAPET